MSLPPPSRRPRAGAPSRQAENFRQTRREHAHEIAEDYVEAIAEMAVLQGEARVVDLARQLGVTHVTVNRTLARLRQAGYVNTPPYRAIYLTPAGRRLAAACKRRHQTVVAFLRSLGIPAATAERDAEGIEHHVSSDTLAAFVRHLETGQRRAVAKQKGRGTRPRPRN